MTAAGDLQSPPRAQRGDAPRPARRGFTLVELLVALALLGVLATGIYQVLVATRRDTHAQAQWIDLRRNLRAAATALAGELRELAASDGDLYALGKNELRIRAMRQFSLICREPLLERGVVGLSLVVFRQAGRGPRFAPLDSVLAFHEGDEPTSADDGWAAGVVTSTREVACPDGSPGDEHVVSFRVPTGTQLNRPGAIPRGAAIRGFEPRRYAAYRAGDGLWYLGVDSPGSAIQPLVGPLLASDGLELRYRDRLGELTTAAGNVALVEIRVRARTVDPVWDARRGRRSIAVDSVVIQVALRNNRSVSSEW